MFLDICNERDPLVRFDQYKRSDSQEHKDKLLAEGTAVKKLAAERHLTLLVKTTNVGPEPSWCEEILATVSRHLLLDETRSASRCLSAVCLYRSLLVERRTQAESWHIRFPEVPYAGTANLFTTSWTYQAMRTAI